MIAPPITRITGVPRQPGLSIYFPPIRSIPFNYELAARLLESKMLSLSEGDIKTVLRLSYFYNRNCSLLGDSLNEPVNV